MEKLKPFLLKDPVVRLTACATTALAIFVLNLCSGVSRTRLSVPGIRAGAAYYLDCAATQSGGGTQNSPWNSLAAANGFTFRPGDRLLLKRGTTCFGALTPVGSGAPNEPIVIDTYGTGAQPIINGGDSEAAVKLFDQQYWEVNNLEIIGGSLYGVYVSGNSPNSSLTHIYLRNLDVHGATYRAKKRADSGEVFFSSHAPGQVFNDVVIDEVTAHDSRVSEGIFVSAGGAWIEAPGSLQPLGHNVTVQNSTAHDIYGDGILISEVRNGLLQHNVVYRSGLCPDCTGSTPVGLWEWYCKKCMVQFNESYANQSWDGDGGDFDIDYFNDDNILQYNYGHDSAGYCVAFFGAGGRASVNNVFRFNVCSNDGRKADLSKQGEIFLHTWDGGSLNGVQIYNNTIYWNPAANAPALSGKDAIYSAGSPLLFENNIIYATVSGLIQIPSSFSLDHNIYWTTADSPPRWQVDAQDFNDFHAYQAATRKELHSYFADPKLSTPAYHAVGRPATAFQPLRGSPVTGAGTNVCRELPQCSVGALDFWGNALSSGRAINIGAFQGP